MNNKNSLLPLLLEILSQKQEFSETYQNVCKEIEELLPTTRNKSYQEALEKALDIGQNLGILTLSNDIIQAPFNFKTGPKAPKTTEKIRRTLGQRRRKGHTQSRSSRRRKHIQSHRRRSRSRHY